jgi:hypothetical protein
MDVAGGCWVSGVEVCYFFQSILNAICIFLEVSFYSITFPFDQVLKSSSEHPTVEDFLCKVFFFFTIDKFQRWWQGPVLARNWVRWCQGQLNHIKDWVKSFH